ncbi:MAG: serine hydrolase domain-containing protein [Pedobacter sp.]|nr:serine hydrolase domain-containing protein [Pedobacter sp.]MDQ8052170.1 serine hydrolase domain-containing protein [Pedobacter sp.]
MHRFFKIRFCLMIVALSIAGHSFAQSTKVEADIQEIMKKRSVVGLAVAVVKDNQLIYTHAFGSKDLESKTPLTNEALFRIASISKSFSATSIMQLVEAKKFALSDDFSNLVGFKVRNPKFPDAVITLKMVLSHTSSINDSQGYFNLDVINPAKNPNWAKCYNDYAPGAGYQYCNLNFNMVGTVIEKVSGERFDQYVKHHILDPLGLYGGYCVDSLDKSRFATLYEYDDKTKQFTAATAAYNPRSEEIKNYTMGYSTPILSPTGGMKITATDLAKYMMMHMNYGKYDKGRIISKKSSKTMQTKLSDEENYGLALRISDKLIPGETMVGHTGSAYGLYSVMFFEPKQKFGIVVITNGCNPVYEYDFCAALRDTANALYGEFISKGIK